MEKKLSAEEQMKQDIYQAIGHGSVCWSKPPDGEFDSLEATAAAEILWNKVQEYASQFKGEAVSDAVDVHWKEGFIKTFDEAYTDFELSQLMKYIEENIINKTT